MSLPLRLPVIKKHCLTVMAFVVSVATPLAQAQSAEGEGSQSQLLEEIIVTAQHRAQDVRDVPIVITTLSTDDLNRYFQGGEDARALAGRVPGLHAESSNGRVAPRFYIRGLGNTDFDLASSQPVSVIMDDVVQENVILKGFPLFDVERVEVLKGPQGTLYGRNTPAGIIKINTREPDFERDAHLSFSQAIGSVENRVVEGAVGGGIVEGILAGRFSFYSLARPNWVENGFPDASPGFGEIKDQAFRVQLLFQPSQNFNALFGIRSRDYDAKPAVFRANAIGPRNNQLNENYNRKFVQFDESPIGTTLQGYDTTAANLRMEFDWDSLNLKITSITAYIETSGTSQGDVDGGITALAAAAAGIDDVPTGNFAAFTGDGLKEFEQVTEELRFAFDLNRLNVQAGVFLFESDFTILTENFITAFAFKPLPGKESDKTSVRHTNEAWGVFGQASFDLSDSFNITAGVRFTGDDKSLSFVEADSTPSFDPLAVSGDDLSWDAAFLYQASERLNFFGRVARGFRAPSIQGRGVTFDEAPSVADSETITSVEGGVKLYMAEANLRVNASIYYYEVKDQQLTSIGGASNVLRLVNAKKGVGEGLDIDIEWRPKEWLGLNLGYSLNKTELQDENLRVSTCRGGCTVTDPTIIINPNRPESAPPILHAFINGNPFPNAPEYTLFFGVNLTYGMDDGSEVFFNSDYVKQGKINFFLYESEEFNSSGDFELGLELGYRSATGRYQVSAFGRNVTNEANLKGGVDFANITGFTNEPRIVGFRFRINTI